MLTTQGLCGRLIFQALGLCFKDGIDLHTGSAKRSIDHTCWEKKIKNDNINTCLTHKCSRANLIQRTAGASIEDAAGWWASWNTVPAPLVYPPLRRWPPATAGILSYDFYRKCYYSRLSREQRERGIKKKNSADIASFITHRDEDTWVGTKVQPTG